MNIQELIKMAEGLNIALKENNEVDGQNLNICIDVLYTLEEIALDEDDTECAQFLKDARIYVENYRKDRILDMGEKFDSEDKKKPTEAELDDIYEAAQILYREMDKEYYEEEEKEVLSNAYDILRDYSTEV